MNILKINQSAHNKPGTGITLQLFCIALHVVIWTFHIILVRVGYRDIGDRISELSVKVGELSATLDAEEEMIYDDVPDEFLDGLMCTLMSDPVLLPHSGNIVDKSTIAR